MQDADLASVAALLKNWDEDMKDHFKEEERLLLPLAPVEAGARMLREHQEIRHAVKSIRDAEFDPEAARSLGHRIHDHIRWEEREFFPNVEKSPDLESIAAETNAMEERRHNPAHPFRAEQVARRAKGN
jgi:hemerythrin